MPELHPKVEQIIRGGGYLCRPRVEGFCEHELKNAKGEVVRAVTKENLEEFAKVNNAKAAQGTLSPIGPGHTFDDVYDEKGQLVRKFPESQQPKPFGYIHNLRVEWNPEGAQGKGCYSLYHDEYIQRTIFDPETGREVNGLDYSASFPRRSAEAYHKEHWIDWMAALRRAPRLDLAMQAYAHDHPDHTLYARSRNGADAPVILMARGKTRYSMDTGGEMEDPTKPPTAAPTPAAPAAPAAAGTAADLPPEHAEAAQQYARHASGMHHTQMKRLMGHLHQKYAAECGLPSDMNMEYAMAAPGPAATMPGGPGGHTPPTTGTPPANPTVAPPKEEPNRMQHDQLAIEKERYERRLADLEARAAAAEKKELDGHMRYELQQMVAEGFDINAATELDLMQKSNYGRSQVDQHVATLRRVAHKAPVGTLPPLNDLNREFRTPPPVAPTGEVPGTVSEDEFAKMSRYQRQHPEMPWDEVKTKYQMNGAAK